jgi:hypothetical protein
LPHPWPRQILSVWRTADFEARALSGLWQVGERDESVVEKAYASFSSRSRGAVTAALSELGSFDSEISATTCSTALLGPRASPRRHPEPAVPARPHGALGGLGAAAGARASWRAGAPARGEACGSRRARAFSDVSRACVRACACSAALACRAGAAGSAYCAQGWCVRGEATTEEAGDCDRVSHDSV